MITATTSADGQLMFNVAATGVPVYLDNFALIQLAKGNSSTRERFVAAIHNGADLLFSVANAAELSGPQGRSEAVLRSFLNEVGPRWFPVELDPFEVVKRELAGGSASSSCVCDDFLRRYFVARTRDYSPGCGQIIDLSPNFFRLGPVLDWVGPQRQSIRRGIQGLDDALRVRIGKYRSEYQRDSRWLDLHFPVGAFDQSKRATFIYGNLIRTLTVEAKAYLLKKGDGVDFCHAVMASVFASLATLDKHWKRRVEGLPKPNHLARIYYAQELDAMVADLESLVESKA